VPRSDHPSDHPTIVPQVDKDRPPYDPLAASQVDTERGGPRSEMPTFTDEVELEAARIKSKFSLPPQSNVPTNLVPPPGVTLPPPAVASPMIHPPPPSAPAAPPASAPSAAPDGPPTPFEPVGEADYLARFGSFDKVPVVVLQHEALAQLTLDGRASMLLALLDGRSSIQTILDIGILNPIDTLGAIEHLVEKGVIILLG
jgi:hypothetical protein